MQEPLDVELRDQDGGKGMEITSPRDLNAASVGELESTKVRSVHKTSIDREKVCPFFLRMFIRENGHHRVEEFEIDRFPEEDEVQIYTWKDATLKELSNLIKEVYPQARHKEVKFSFRLIYTDLRGKFVGKELGITFNSRRGKDDEKSLEDARFVTGDYMDVAIILHGGAGRALMSSGSSFGSMRSIDRSGGPIRSRRPPASSGYGTHVSSRSGHDDRFYRDSRDRREDYYQSRERDDYERHRERPRERGDYRRRREDYKHDR